MITEITDVITYAGGPSVEEVRSRVDGARIYKLSSNESPFGPSPMVLQAIARSAATLNSYAPRDDLTLRQALAAFHGRDLTPEHFTSGVAGVELLDIIAQAFLEPGDDVLICPPTFGWYVKTAERRQANVISVPLASDSFAHNIEGIARAITPQTKLVYICNPNNPTGAMMTAAEMADLSDCLPAHVTLLADDVYCHFVDREDYPDNVKAIREGRNVIRLQSFSKAYGLAGLRLGYVMAPPALIAKIRAKKRPFHNSSLSLDAGIAALADQPHVARTVATVHEGLRYLYRELSALGIKTWPTQGNFLLMQPEKNGDALYDGLLSRGVMIRPTRNNGLPGAFRVTVGLPEANAALIGALRDMLGTG